MNRSDRETEPLIALEARLALGTLTLDLSLVSQSPRMAIVGPSGSGKSTCLRILAGLARPSEGTVRYRGTTWSDAATRLWVPPWKRRVGWVPQDALLFPHRTVRDNLGYAGRATDEELLEVSAFLGLVALMDRQPRNLSGGERQRVALGRALLAVPELLLLDEPFAALDEPLRKRVAEALFEYVRTRSIPFVLASHDTSVIDSLCAERWSLHAGRITPG